MKIVTIVGARPQFIKAAAVSRAISEHNRLSPNTQHLTEIIIHTGQHYDKNMSDIFFNELQIPKPNYCLDIHGLSHGAMTGQMMEKIEKMLLYERPDMVLVYGDTNTTLAGALAAVKLHIPVAHVEAGLRSFNRLMPEEINRVLTDHISSILFCPTETAVSNLRKEGFTNIFYPADSENSTNSMNSINTNNSIVLNVGDVMYDLILFYSSKIKNDLGILTELGIDPKEYGLVTIHREENTDSRTRLINILEGLNSVSEELAIIWPMHPRNKNFVNQLEFNFDNRFRIIEPMGYLHFLQLEQNAQMIFTDSGGIQKEAYFFQVPCITLRDETEWVETIQSGMNTLAGADRRLIENAYHEMKNKDIHSNARYFGDGRASEKIMDVLASSNFNNRPLDE